MRHRGSMESILAAVIDHFAQDKNNGVASRYRHKPKDLS